MAFHRELVGDRLFLGFTSGNMEVLRRGQAIDFKQGDLLVRVLPEGNSYRAGNGLVVVVDEAMRRFLVDGGVGHANISDMRVTAVFGRTPKLAGEAMRTVKARATQ